MVTSRALSSVPDRVRPGATVNKLGERAGRRGVGAACPAWLTVCCLLPAWNQTTAALLPFVALDH